MQRIAMFEELAELTALDAPAGYEEPVLAYAQRRFRENMADVALDVRGNLYGFRQGTDHRAPNIMVMTHADEIGLHITHVEPEGFLRFTQIGGITHTVLPGARVRILTEKDKIGGVVGARPGHLMTDSASRQVPAISDMYIDVGATSELEVATMGIEPGAPAVLASRLALTNNHHRVFGKAVDNRAGLYAQLKLAEHVRSNPLPANLSLVVTVEEEVGLRGAAVAAKCMFPVDGLSSASARNQSEEAPASNPASLFMRDLETGPDIVIALDTIPAGGTPDVSRRSLPWEIGQGPVIKVRETHGLFTHRPLREHFRRVAHEHQIPIQTVVDTAGITDASVAQQASGAIAALTLALPRRYAHSAVEMLDLDDLENLIRLLVLTLPALNDRAMLRRLP